MRMLLCQFTSSLTAFQMVDPDNCFSTHAEKFWRCAIRMAEGSEFMKVLKVPQSITHENLLLSCQAELDGFLGAARLLGDKLACCFLQFGYFNRKAFASLDAFLDRLQPF
jgi:uncharacterized protein YecE (DUF72 family)